MHVLVLSSVFTGLLIAAFIKAENSVGEDRSLTIGRAGDLLTFFAVDCPVCNKVALVALGYSGALLLGYALRKRLIGESNCSVRYQVENSDIKNFKRL